MPTVVPMVLAGAQIAEVAGSAMVSAIKSLYGISKSINEFIDEHIEQMKGSDKPTISRTGRVLEMAKFGFGLGYITPVLVIATGQLILGNTLAAVATVATAATLTNPIAMTCAAIGAIYYGWGALSEQEQNEMIEKISKGLEVGVELIKSVLRFVIEKTKELLSKKNFEEMKKYIASAANVFGKTLGDVTHKITDITSDAFDGLKKKTSDAMDATVDFASNTYDGIKEKAEITVVGTRESIKKLKSKSEQKKIE